MLSLGVHAQVLADGVLVGALQRNGGVSIVLGDEAGAVAAAAGDANVTLDIVVEGVGRTNTGLKFDVKGLTSGLVLLNSARPARPPPLTRCGRQGSHALPGNVLAAAAFCQCAHCDEWPAHNGVVLLSLSPLNERQRPLA